jgi:hypothetical protein
MSEPRKVVSYDFKKLIKNVEVSTAFIPGLQNVFYRYVTEFKDDPETIGFLIDKFHKIIQGELKGETAILTPVENEIYTIFSLAHLFKALAKEQGLELLQELPVDDDKLKEFAEEAKTKGSLSDSLAHIADKLNNYKEDENSSS